MVKTNNNLIHLQLQSHWQQTASFSLNNKRSNRNVFNKAATAKQWHIRITTNSQTDEPIFGHRRLSEIHGWMLQTVQQQTCWRWSQHKHQQTPVYNTL